LPTVSAQVTLKIYNVLAELVAVPILQARARISTSRADVQRGGIILRVHRVLGRQGL